MKQATKKEVIEIYADPELKRRVEAAAAQRHLSVAEYGLEAIRQRLAYDVALEGEQNGNAITSMTQDPTLLAEMRELRERILAERGGKPIEIDILELVRSERDDELTSMR